MKWIIVILLLSSCNETKKIPALKQELDASKSYDPDGYIVKWEWRQITPSSDVAIAKPNSSITVVTSKKSGVFQIELTVTDNGGATGKDTCTIKY